MHRGMAFTTKPSASIEINCAISLR